MPKYDSGWMKGVVNECFGVLPGIGPNIALSALPASRNVAFLTLACPLGFHLRCVQLRVRRQTVGGGGVLRIVLSPRA